LTIGWTISILVPRFKLTKLPPQETVGGEPIERVSPLDAAIVGALDGVKMAVAIAAVLNPDSGSGEFN
jgi:hypothetical protein